MIQKTVEKLKKELTAQIRDQWQDFPAKEKPEPPYGRMLVLAETITASFEYDDHKEPGHHTPEHGQSLRPHQVRWLLNQADDIFEKHTLNDKERWYLWNAEEKK